MTHIQSKTMINLQSTISDYKKGKIVMMVLIVLFAMLWWYSISFEKSLHSNFVTTTAKILEITHPAKSSPKVNFIYFYKGRQYYESQSFPDFKDYKQTFILVNKSFPLVIDSTNPSHIRLLMDANSFREFGLPNSDSIKWLQEYLK